ncbi:hypothetical protein CTAYLR_010369 [Chrysophaeum taylorii]|uniref:Uncharacterized protein n=1 Tax=Chrysophaeum taylorii TaxID=2483200 RepID=A0AAD7U7Z7_9STRA|nr:hypothetical protein CTAYLR_010369 [Chrysophaeum taylorii]
MLVRDAVSWLRSYYEQIACGQVTFGDWLVKDSAGLIASAPDTLARVQAVFDDVQVASLDHLLEVGNTVASFLICNASFELASDAWSTCAKTIDAKFTHSNPTTTSMLECDLEPLARALTLARGCEMINPKQEQIEALADRLTTTCDDNDHNATSYFGTLLEPTWRAWLENVLPPSHLPAPRHAEHICLVDVARLSKADVRAILQVFLGQCESGVAAAAS